MKATLRRHSLPASGVPSDIEKQRQQAPSIVGVVDDPEKIGILDSVFFG